MPALLLRARGLAALALLLLFPVVVLLFVVGLVQAGIWLTLRSVSGAAIPFMISVLIVVALTRAVWNALRSRRPKPLPGPELTAVEHPALWAELEELATAMNQPLPDRVVVHPTVNAFVTTASRRREVMIGYPLLASLTRPQLRAVLAHEMGHLAHGHTGTGWVTYRASSLLEQTIDGLDGSQAQRLVVLYHRLYLRISISVLRDHEHQADVWSARLAGGARAASVFPAIVRLRFVWDLLQERYLPLAAQVEARPPLASALTELTRARAGELNEVVARELTREPSRWDTHPSDAERMARLEALPGTNPATDTDPATGLRTATDADAPAWQLLGRPSGLSAPKAPKAPTAPDVAWTALLAIEAALLPPDTITATWEQVMDRSELSTARRDVHLVQSHPIGSGPDRRANLRELLETLSSESGRHIGAALIRADLPRGYWEGALNIATARAARAALLVALADQGRARAVLRWDHPSPALQYRTAVDEFRSWPEELTLPGPLDPALVTRALEWLVRDGIDVDAALRTEVPSETKAGDRG